MDNKCELDPLVGSRLIRLPEVLKIVAMGKTRLYVKVADGSFPKPIRLSERQVRWVLADVIGWVESLKRHSSMRVAGHGVSPDQVLPNQRHCQRATDTPRQFIARRSGDRRRT